MALMLGIRLLVTSGLAGAAVAVTHQSTKVTKEKLYKWVGEKVMRRSPDPAACFPNSGDAGVNKSDDAVMGVTAPVLSPSDADQLPPHNTINGDLTAEKADLCPRESDPVPSSVNAVPFQGAREPELPSPTIADNAVKGDPTAGSVPIDEVKPTCEAPDLDRASPAKLALTAVQGEPTDEPARSEDVNLSREAPEPVVVTGSPALSAVQGESAALSPRSEVANLRREAPEQARARGSPVQGEPKKKKKKRKNKKAEPADEPPRSEDVNLSREAPEPVVVTGSPALSTVQGESTSVPSRSEVANQSREAPEQVRARGSPALPAVQAEPKKKKKKRKNKKAEPAAEPPRSEDVNLRREASEPVVVTGSPALPSGQGESASLSPRSELVNLSREAPEHVRARGWPALSAVQGEPAAEPPGSEAVNLHREAPDLARATGVPYHPVPGSEAIKLTWDWEAADPVPHPDADPPFKGMPPDPPPATGFGARVKARARDVWAFVKVWATDLWARAMKDPDLRYKILRIPKGLLLVFVDYQCRHRLKAPIFWFEDCNKIFRFELSKLYAFF